jgi:hypothetical protein
MTPDEIAALDAGIRDVVVLLNAHGLRTTDSGDGVSKSADERVFHMPHVVCVVPVDELVNSSHRAARLLGPEWEVQAQYNPRDGVANIFACKPEDR